MLHVTDKIFLVLNFLSETIDLRTLSSQPRPVGLVQTPWNFLLFLLFASWAGDFLDAGGDLCSMHIGSSVA